MRVRTKAQYHDKAFRRALWGDERFMWSDRRMSSRYRKRLSSAFDLFLRHPTVGTRQ